MPIIGIDLKSCTKCKLCLKDCPALCFKWYEEVENIQFDNSRGCLLCGHCIAVCPENAILYENMKGDPLNFEKDQDPIGNLSYEVLHPFLRAKRSIRQYKNKKVPKDIVDKVVESMRYACTGANIRTLKCLIISDEEKIKLLSDSIIDFIALETPETNLIKKRNMGIDPIFYHAPLVVIFYSNNQWNVTNATIAMTFGMLSAQSLGLGSCWIGYAHGVLMENSEIRIKQTGIETYILGVMTLGYPAVKYPRAPPRPPLNVRRIEDVN